MSDGFAIDKPNPKYPGSYGVHLRIGTETFGSFARVLAARGLSVRGEPTPAGPSFWPSRRRDGYTSFCYAVKPPQMDENELHEAVRQALRSIDTHCEPEPVAQPISTCTYDDWYVAFVSLRDKIVVDHEPSSRLVDELAGDLRRSIAAFDYDQAFKARSALYESGVPWWRYAAEDIWLRFATNDFTGVVECFEQCKASVRSKPRTLLRVASAYMRLHEEDGLERWLNGASNALSMVNAVHSPSDVYGSYWMKFLSAEVAFEKGDYATAARHGQDARLAAERSEGIASIEDVDELLSQIRVHYSESSLISKPPVDESTTSVVPLNARPTIAQFRQMSAKGKHEEIVSCFEKWFAAGSLPEPEHWLIAGLAAHRSGHESALQWLQRADEEGMANYDALMALGSLAGSDRTASMHYYKRACLEQPDSIEAADALTAIAMDTADHTGAVEACNRIISTFDTVEKALKGELFYELRHYHMAMLLGGQSANEVLHEDYVQACVDLIDLYLSQPSSKKRDALKVFGEAQRPLADEPHHLIAVASALERSDDSSHTKAACDSYVNIAMAQADRAPFHDAWVFRDAMQRVFLIAPEFLDVITEAYRENVSRAQAHQDVLGIPSIGLGSPDPVLPDLSGERLVIVGGYGPVRRRAIRFLEEKCHPTSITEIPPPWEESGHLRQRDVSAAIEGKSLIVEVTGCVKHSTTAMVSNALLSHSIPRIRARGTGHSSIVQAILEWYQEGGQGLVA